MEDKGGRSGLGRESFQTLMQVWNLKEERLGKKSLRLSHKKIKFFQAVLVGGRSSSLLERFCSSQTLYDQTRVLDLCAAC